MMNRTVKIILLIMYISLIPQNLFCNDIKMDYLKVMTDYLSQPQYALKYESYLVSNEGIEEALNDGNSLVVKGNLLLYTSTSLIDYLVNAEGSLVINHKLKKINVTYDPYTASEKDSIERNINTKMSESLLKSINQCDSVTRIYLNGYIIYTTYATNSPYTKAECWVDSNNRIKEVRYYYREESEFLYYRLIYNIVPVQEYIKLASFSNYVELKGNKYVPTTKYKEYEIIVGN